MARLEEQLERLQELLSDTDLYSEARKQELADLLARDANLKARSAQLEDTWLEVQQQLEDLAR